MTDKKETISYSQAMRNVTKKMIGQKINSTQLVEVKFKKGFGSFSKNDKSKQPFLKAKALIEMGVAE